MNFRQLMRIVTGTEKAPEIVLLLYSLEREMKDLGLTDR